MSFVVKLVFNCPILSSFSRSVASCFSKKQDQTSNAIYEIIKTEYESLGKVRYVLLSLLSFLVISIDYVAFIPIFIYLYMNRHSRVYGHLPLTLSIRLGCNGLAVVGSSLSTADPMYFVTELQRHPCAKF